MREEAADKIVEIIELAETRAMAVDGPVGPTIDQMTDADIRRIYWLARGEDDPDEYGQ